MSKSESENALKLHGAVAAAILGKLLQGGISRTEISFLDFHQTFSDLKIIPESDAENLFSDVIEWLSAEGIIRFDNGYAGTKNEEIFQDCVITAKGFAILQSGSEILGGRTPADVIHQTNKLGASHSDNSKLGSLFGGFFGGFIKSIS